MWWRLDTVGIAPHEQHTTSEHAAMNKVQSSIVSTERMYQVSLPFHGPECPDTNYRNAFVQLNALETQFLKDPEYRRDYENVLHTYLDAGFISEVTDSKINGHYLPHFGVKKQSLMAPLRIVFNTSFKVKGELSLNDCLYPGPNLVEMVYDLLLKFRPDPYALVPDILKAFHRALLHPNDTKYAGFLWRQGPKRAATYAFNFVVFGIPSSTYLLQQVLQTHLHEQVWEDIIKAFYVDNYLQTFVARETKERDYYQVKSLLDEAHMPLKGWASNCREFDQQIGCKEPVEINVLGTSWDRREDKLSLTHTNVQSCSNSSHPLIKCMLISLLVANFDPLGLVSPLFVWGKILLQELWEAGVDWDDVLSDDHQLETSKLLTEFNNIPNCKFQRGIVHKGSKLHLFTDLLNKAYYAVAYVRQRSEHVSFLPSKMRVTPRKAKLTIPKLELLALLLGFRLGKHLCKLFIFTTIMLWTDSTVAIAWVGSRTGGKITFISNQLGEIQQECGIEMKYVPTKQNPAFILTRDSTLHDLKVNCLRHEGPPFLHCEGTPEPCVEEGESPIQQNAITATLRELREEGTLTPPAELWKLLGSNTAFRRLMKVMSLVLKFGNC
ncbi:uncharacterized protein LOC135225335 [Macrobrachium nipponense]|uniref:uncharacterized protein LOC135225335 n=1 Tax=Macrobrachium nipponense TaxID=159736 RepID=UPI0030C80A79